MMVVAAVAAGTAREPFAAFLKAPGAASLERLLPPRHSAIIKITPVSIGVGGSGGGGGGGGGAAAQLETKIDRARKLQQWQVRLELLD